MISIIKSLHRLIGQNGIRLVPSILLSMLDSVLNSCMYGVMLFVLIDLSNGQFSAEGLKMCIIVVVIIFTLRCIVQGISFTQAQCVGPDWYFFIKFIIPQKRLLSYPFKGGCSLFLLRVFLQRLSALFKKS